MYPIFNLSEAANIQPETVGSKEKTWVAVEAGGGLQSGRYLFKVGRPGTGENWAEKASCEIAKVMQLPCADYELAIREDQQGVLSRSFIPDGASLFLGNSLLARTISGYDGSKQFNQLKYTLETVVGLLKRLETFIGPPLANGIPRLRLLDFFVGYIVLDTLIGNTDRHHENWGIITASGSNAGDQPQYFLAPTFDHASSLGRSETDEKRLFRLRTADERATVEAYAARARSAFYEEGTTQTLLNSDVLARLKQYRPRAVQFWADQVKNLSDDTFTSIFRSFDSSWISEPAIEFAQRMIAFNRTAIGDIANG